MKKTLSGLLPALLILLTSCGAVGDKSASMSIIYGITAVVSFLLLIGYCVLIKKKDVCFLLLFSSVFVVNIGYFAMSISGTIGEALLANRISYLGSVFLPFSMLMTIFNLSRLKYKKWVPVFLFIVTTAIFFIAASYPYLDIYYKSATLDKVNGTSVLVKEYGPWHQVYLYYLVSYFLVMICATLHAVISKKIKSGIQSAIILIAVFVNICVWLLEQLVDMSFEFLSVSYIISELFLLSLYLLIQEHEKLLDASKQAESVQKEAPSDEISGNSEVAEKCRYIKENLHTLTPTERSIYDCYLAGKGTKEVLLQLDITENTLKFHNKNIYSKLGVSSRKQLIEYVSADSENS